MVQRLRNITLLTMAIAIILGSWGCNKKDENPNLDANKQLSLFMNDMYFWYEMMPDVDPEAYPSPVELLEALRYKELDKWSYISTRAQLEAYYQSGEYVGFGIGTAFDQDQNLWISFIFDDSPLRQHGVDRGWKIKAIDGITPTIENISSLFGPATSGITKNFTFVNQNNEPASFAATKRAIVMNTVLLDTTFTNDNGTIGYLVLNGFIGPTMTELDNTFNNFIDKGVTDLIVDLRYNTGGMITTAEHLANLIAGVTANDQILGSYIYNDKQTNRNEHFYFSALNNSLSLSRVVFITTGLSASASELVINGLFPHIDVTLVGARTYGKPVGMGGVYYGEWAFVPITFKIVNSEGVGDYYDGIPVDYEEIDGINYPFGDLSEPSLNSAISFLTGGAKKTNIHHHYKLTYPKYKGLQSEIGAW